MKLELAQTTPTFQSLSGSKNAREIEWHPKRDEGVARGRKKKRKKEKNLNRTYLNTQKGIEDVNWKRNKQRKKRKVIQWMPLNVITLVPKETDYIIQMITISKSIMYLSCFKNCRTAFAQFIA